MDNQEIKKLLECKCLRCGHVWVRRTAQPRECPNCKSPAWSKPPKNVGKEDQTSYDASSDEPTG